ncbi:hypothetical protein C6P42_003754 [Pichia californica]|nr:hypothetical protein C6P42_003754 [[Candida] californica]
MKYGSASSSTHSELNSTNNIDNNIDPLEEQSCCDLDDDDDESVQSYLNNNNTNNNSHGILTSRNIPHINRNTDNSSTTLSEKFGYYIPCYNWLSEYKLSYLTYDILAGLSLASYQIPLSMSFATALAHVPTASGLLGLSIGPIVYMFMGTVPQMIVGPEAAVSMIIGQNIETITKHYPEMDPVDILCNMTFLSGIVLLIFGILRFGYLDNVLCGTLLRGFITAIGLSMILNSIISMLGLQPVLSNLPPNIHVHSAAEKFIFLINHWNNYHKMTTSISFISFLILLFLSKTKKILIKKNFKIASYFPEILFVIVLFTIFSYIFDFDNKGIKIIGYVNLDDFKFRNPLSKNNRKWWGKLFPVSFVCAILGFFETSTAAKSLSSMLEMPVSSNRELVSLGTVGTTVSWFGALPSFGGYARSKLNAMIGAKTPISGFVMGLTTLFVIFNLLNYIYYLPLCVLNSVIAIVGWGMIEETPKELKFHIRTKGWNEILTFIVTLSASLYYSIEIGVSMGCFYSLMRVLKHSTQSRVQILSRISGTDTFVNPDFDNSDSNNFFKFPKKIIVSGYKEFRRQSMVLENPTNAILNEFTNLNNNNNNNNNNNSLSQANLDRDKDSNITQNLIQEQKDIFPKLEDREGCLIVKIAEPLTFFNANDMKGRLKRIELYGSTHGHPGSKQKTNKSLRHVVFDLHGMTSIDSSATQILYDIVDNYQRRGINVFFTRIFKSKNLIQRLKDSGIEELLSLVDGEEFGIRQTIRPYYDDILDALKAIDKIDSSCEWETRSYFSSLGFE